MKLKLYQTSLDSKPITFLTFEGPKEVETLEVAATLAKRNCFPSYAGRSVLQTLLPRPLSTVHELIDSTIARKNGLNDFHRLANIASQEHLNHGETPETERVLLVEKTADLAIAALTQLSATRPSELVQLYPGAEATEYLTSAGSLVGQIRQAFVSSKI